MKRKRKGQRILMLLLVLVLALEGAGTALAKVGTGWDDECRANQDGDGRHGWKIVSETPGATCTSNGEATYRCAYCGARITRASSPPGHAWGAWQTVEEATCTRKGKQTRTCGRCGKTESRETEKAAHTWTEWAAEGDGTGAGADPLAMGDTGSEWKTTEGDSCLREVMETRLCRVCGTAQRRTVRRDVHIWEPWTVTLAPTDFSAGERQRTCRVCGKTETESFDPVPTYRKGDSGDGVLKLQEGLNGAGYSVGIPDGHFGTKTENAVKAIERAHGVTADGVAWPGVQAWLRKPDISACQNGDNAHHLMSNLRGGTSISDILGNTLAITQHPNDVTAEEGESATLTVVAAGGTKPYSYEWHRVSPVTGYPAFALLPSALKALFMDRTVSGDGSDCTVEVLNCAFEYYCVVRDAGGQAVKSEAARVAATPKATATPAPTATPKPAATPNPDKLVIIKQPQDTKIRNNRAELFCKAGYRSGKKAALIYRWKKKASSGGWNYINRSGGRLRLSGKNISGFYRCIVRDAHTGKLVISRKALVYSKLRITKQARKVLSSTLFGWKVQFKGGIAPYHIKVERIETYQTNKQGTWVTETRKVQVRRITRRKEGTCTFTLPRNFKTSLNGITKVMKATYIITITDASGQSVTKQIKAK